MHTATTSILLPLRLFPITNLLILKSWPRFSWLTKWFKSTITFVLFMSEMTNPMMPSLRTHLSMVLIFLSAVTLLYIPVLQKLLLLRPFVMLTQTTLKLILLGVKTSFRLVFVSLYATRCYQYGCSIWPEWSIRQISLSWNLEGSAQYHMQIPIRFAVGYSCTFIW